MINRLDPTQASDSALVQRVVGLAMSVHNGLGCGFLESLYVTALTVELRETRIAFEREVRYPVLYKNVEIGCFHADLVIEGRLIVECKAIDALAVPHSVQLVNYLAASKIDLGLLINFGPKRLEFKTNTRLYSAFDRANSNFRDFVIP